MGVVEDWDRFGRRLAQVLPALEERSFLLVSWSALPTVYVQFSQLASELRVQSGADDVMPPGRRLGSVGAERMRSLGWTAPEDEATAQHTWHTALGWPARSVDYRRVAQMCLQVLRDVHSVPDPGVLEYQAWREAEPAPVGLTHFEGDLEPFEPHLEFPVLDIPDSYRS